MVALLAGGGGSTAAGRGGSTAASGGGSTAAGGSGSTAAGALASTYCDTGRSSNSLLSLQWMSLAKGIIQFN